MQLISFGFGDDADDYDDNNWHAVDCNNNNYHERNNWTINVKKLKLWKNNSETSNKSSSSISIIKTVSDEQYTHLFIIFQVVEEKFVKYLFGGIFLE